MSNDAAWGFTQNGSYETLGLHEIGVEFDRGVGLGGRDWEWDWSLKGPISVRFRGPCRTIERRQ